MEEQSIMCSAISCLLFYIVLYSGTFVLCEGNLEALYFTKGKGPGGNLHFKEDQTTEKTENISTPEHTICFRYKATAYDSPHYIYQIEFSEDQPGLKKIREETDEEVFLSSIYTLVIYPPGQDADIIFQARANPTQWTQILAEGGTYYTSPDIKAINVGEWHHFCGGTSVQNRNMFFVQNGKTAYNWSQPQSRGGKENFLSSNIIKKPFETFLPRTDGEEGNGEQVSFAYLNLGYTHNPYHLTDFNIWGRALSTEEMYAFTTCKEMMKGDWYSWDVNDWGNEDDNVTYQVTTESISSVCSTTESKYEFFPDLNSFYDNHNLCKLFGGRSANTSTRKQVDEAAIYVNKICFSTEGWQCSSEWLGASFYARYNDIANFNEWVDFETNEPSPEPIAWNYGEPNGGDFENCAQILYIGGKHVGRHNDLPCDWRAPSLCEGVGNLKLSLRGLCKGTIYDTKYIMKFGTSGEKRYFTGNFGWSLEWDYSKWKISHKEKKHTKLVYNDGSLYPFGRNFWQVGENDTSCKGMEGQAVLLNLSPCNESSFTCDNGFCITMEKRCDQKLDCEDVTDEKQCKIVSIDPKKYLKGKPPPPIGNDEKVVINVEVHLLKILEVGEVAALFRAQFELFLKWKDPRITFWNLKFNQDLNTLVSQEKLLIWTPVMVFDNTDKKTRTVTDDESLISIFREGDFVRSPVTTLDNIYLFKGDENSIEISRVYEERWICDYAMNWFPFDTQTCSMTFTATKEMNAFINLVENGHKNLGPTELTQYFIRKTKMRKIQLSKGKAAIEFQVSLGRRLLGTFLTIFLPTILLNVIGHATNYFKAFFFEAVVSVNLTVMLVLTTMFINVSNQLPNTSYIKMIDVWLIFNLILPFSEVLLHTYKDYLREEKREVNHHGRVRTIGEDREDQDDTNSESLSEDSFGVLQNNWMIEAQKGEISVDEDPKMKELKLQMISRQENVQVAAMKEYYEALEEVNANETTLAKCDFIGFYVIPNLAAIFIVTYWITGLLKYNYPEWEFLDQLNQWEILPSFKENSTLSSMADTLMSHFTHLFSTNSTLGRTGLEKWGNMTGGLENKTWTEIAIQTFHSLNQTLQEGKDFLDTM